MEIRPDVQPEPREETSTITRRRLFTIGGFTLASAAVLAACKKKASPAIPVTGSDVIVGKATQPPITDEVFLRTASSLEHTAVDLYQYAINAKILTSKSANVVDVLQSHHQAQAATLETATTSIGGEPFTKRNETVWTATIAPAITKDAQGNLKLSDEETFLEFAYSFEGILAATHQSFVPSLGKSSLRQVLMSVGAAEARHGAVIANLIPSAVLAPGVQPSATATTTTTAKAASSATAVAIYRVPGAFAPLIAALGPNSFEYPAAKATTATT